MLYVNMEYMDLLPPTAPSLVFARETCTPYKQATVNCVLRYHWGRSVSASERLQDTK